MKRRPGEPELFGAAEASAALGVEQTNLRTVSGLPAPYSKVKATTLWRADEIRAHPRAIATTERRQQLQGQQPKEKKVA